MRQLIAGNWKMNGLLAQLDSIAAPLTKVHYAADVLICTPATLLHPARALLALPEVGGALVGGASLVAEDFLAVVRGAAD